MVGLFHRIMQLVQGRLNPSGGRTWKLDFIIPRVSARRHLHQRLPVMLEEVDVMEVKVFTCSLPPASQRGGDEAWETEEDRLRRERDEWRDYHDQAAESTTGCVRRSED